MGTLMSQEVSKWLNLLTNRVYWGYNPLILTFDPNFQRDIQAAGGYNHWTVPAKSHLSQELTHGDAETGSQKHGWPEFRTPSVVW